jgi:hypothetical protein
MGNQNLVVIINEKYAFVIAGDEYNCTGWSPMDIGIDLFKKHIDKLLKTADYPEQLDQSIHKVEFFDLFN